MEERPVLEGTVFVADTALAEGVVVLHHLSDGSQGQLDSVRVRAGGSFSFVLPNVPDPARNDVFFASVRHDDVLYFGPAITRAVDLDSLYEIHAYDTVLAPAEGADVVLEGRSVFVEPDEAGAWRVTDLFQLRNDRNRTVVAREGGRTWSYPLPAEARDVAAGEGEMSLDVATFEDGALVVRAALPPGERLFIARYTLASPFVTIPTPGLTETLDVLIREPVPALDVEGLEPMDQLELEAGSTFRRYNGQSFDAASVRLVEIEVRGPPPVQWIAVILAMVLTVAGLLTMRGRGATPATAGPGRRELLLEIARLDEDFSRLEAPSEGRRRAYEKRRRALLERVRPGA